MRTTIALEDELLRLLKKRAADENRSLQALVNDLLRRALTSLGRPRGYRLKLPVWKAAERPGVDITDRDQLYDLMDRR